MTIRTRPEDARPPLSEAEQRIAVNEHGLTWLPATSLYDIAMSADFQQRSRRRAAWWRPARPDPRTASCCTPPACGTSGASTSTSA
ncbi:hypothetical protein ACFQV4_29305 [Streptomyces thermocarboxydus]